MRVKVITAPPPLLGLNLTCSSSQPSNEVETIVPVSEMNNQSLQVFSVHKLPTTIEGLNQQLLPTRSGLSHNKSHGVQAAWLAYLREYTGLSASLFMHKLG